LHREINARGLEGEIQLTTCGSLGLCEHGPKMIVYPEGIWYSGVRPEDVTEIVQAHFQQNTPVERLARADVAEVRAAMLGNRERMLHTRRAKEAAGVLPDDLNARIRAFRRATRF
jgi:(2Fe-2S) ferredoxin